jgi:hypothetical protein
MSVHRYGLISDTHGRLHPRVFTEFAEVEAIFHAGDLAGEHLLPELEALAPTYAVRGNCDPAAVALPLLRVLEFPFGRLVLTHGHLLNGLAGDPEGLANHFQDFYPRLIVYGHTHRALVRAVEDVWIVNPGSAGKPRFHDAASVMRMLWDDEADTLEFEQIALDYPLASHSVEKAATR